jgi:pimeloyl-ACP methyl ester carboxylesterase
MSQWSLDHSNCDTLSCLQRVTVPVFVLGNQADHLVAPTHTDSTFAAALARPARAAAGDGAGAAAAQPSSELYWVQGASHYYSGPGQKAKLAEAVRASVAWLRRHSLLEPERRNSAESESEQSA